MRRLAGLLVVVACGGPPGPTPTLPPAPVVAPAVAATITSPSPIEARDCGEAGASPTGLPSHLATGRSEVGSGVIAPDGTLQLGKVALRYDASAWHGTMRAGQRGPGLYVEIDRAEVGEHEPWGTLVELHPDATRAVDVGPYHVALKVAAAGAPPAEVAVTVTREVCPPVATIVPGPAPSWFWISTQGVRFFSDPTGMQLQVGLDLRAQQPWLLVRDAGYQQLLPLRPGAPRELRTGAFTLTIERVEMGAQTRFDGQWSADGEARVHALVRVEASRKPGFPDPVPASSACGEPSPVRSATPPALTVTPKLAETRTLKPGQKLQFGPLALDYGSLEIPAHGGGPYREEARQVPHLQVLGPNRAGTSLSAFTRAPQLLRLDSALLRAGPADTRGTIKLERLALRCLSEQLSPPLREPLYLWLGTLGHTFVRLGDFDVKALYLQIYPDPVTPSLNISSENASLMRPLDPALLGMRVTIDDYVVEIVDVEPGLAGPDGFGPPARVQLRVAPRT